MWCELVHDQRPPGRSNSGPRMMSSFDEPAGDHRVHLLAVVGAEVDHDRTVVDLVRLLDRRHDVVGVVDAEADATHRLGPLHVVGQVGREVHLAVALLVEELLPLAHHAEVRVVRGSRSSPGSARRPRSRAPARSSGSSRRRRSPTPSDRACRPWRRSRPAPRSPSCRDRPSSPTCTGGWNVPVLARPHLVLAHAGDEDRVVGRVVAQRLDARTAA